MKSIFITIAVLISSPSVWAYGYVDPSLNKPLNSAVVQAADDKSKATSFGLSAQRAAQEYQCALNPGAEGCLGQTAQNPGSVPCAADHVSLPNANGERTCVPLPSVNGDLGTANTASGGEEKPASDRKAQKTEEEEKVPIPPVRPRTDDDKVTTAQQNQANQCQSAATTANTRCQQSLRSINSLKSEVASLGGTGGTSGESAASACKFLQERAASIGSQMQTFRGQCETAVTACESACSAAVNGLSELRTSAAYVTATNGRSTCSSGRSNVSTMNVNIQQAHDASTRGQQCYRQATGGDTSPNDTASNNSNPGSTNTANNTQQPQQQQQTNNGGGWQMPDFSGLMNANQPTPTTTTQVADLPQDCNNPQFAATSPVCICRLNAADPRCGGTVTSAERLGTAMKDINPNFKTTGDADPNTLRLGGEETPKNGYQPSKMGRYQGQGRGGGNMPSASGNTAVGSASAARGWSYGTPRADSGSGGGGNMAGGRGGGGQAWSPEEGYSGRGGGGARPNVAANPRPQVDLRRFLPGANGNNDRGPANVGAIGLKHTDIFRTVRDRYGRKAESLNP